MKSRLDRTTGSVLFAPIVAGLTMGVIVDMGLAILGSGWEERRFAVQALLLAAIVIGTPSTLIVGLPVHALLLAMRWTRWWSYAIAGGACGILCAAVLYANWYLLETLWGFGRSSEGVDCLDAAGQPAICPDQTEIMVAYIQFAVLLIVAGPFTAVSGWLMRRPDRD